MPNEAGSGACVDGRQATAAASSGTVVRAAGDVDGGWLVRLRCAFATISVEIPRMQQTMRWLSRITPANPLRSTLERY